MAYLIKTCRGYISGLVAAYRACWEQIAVSNLQMLQRVTVISATVFFLFMVYTVIDYRAADMVVAYSLGFTSQAVLAVFVHRHGAQLRRRTRLIRWLCVLCLLLLLSLAVYVGAIGMRNKPGIYFSPITIIVSMLFTLPFWYHLTFISMATVAFVVLSHIYKPVDIHMLDVSMAGLTWALSLVADFVALDLHVRDMNQRRELTRLSSTDSLTGLMNKNKAESAAREYLLGAGKECRSALFVIDLDQFKQINDQMGHQSGDAALEVFGDALLKLFRAGDIVGRVGGDEFVALMKNTSDRRLVARRAALICETVHHTHFRDTGVVLTCSVGVAICTDGSCTYDQLFRVADEQLYQVKRSGKNGYRIA